ncbi:MAG: hypothetical protein AMDU1_APLC00031G0042 [Thermoplasmatales archaeon A-plasma]|nr:MAG: hypothetical protein AMDU1_APLC00031G0042 [Thermoplasmatales archaeon A-plasma]
MNSCLDYGILFSMKTPAEFMPLPGRNIKFISNAANHVTMNCS